MSVLLIITNLVFKNFYISLIIIKKQILCILDNTYKIDL